LVLTTVPLVLLTAVTDTILVLFPTTFTTSPVWSLVMTFSISHPSPVALIIVPLPPDTVIFLILSISPIASIMLPLYSVVFILLICVSSPLALIPVPLPLLIVISCMLDLPFYFIINPCVLLVIVAGPTSVLFPIILITSPAWLVTFIILI